MRRPWPTRGCCAFGKKKRYSFDNTTYYSAEQEFQRHLAFPGHVHLGETGEVCTEIWWRYLRERNYLKDIGVDGMLILRRIFKKWNGEVWTGLLWLRTGTVGGRL
jgi:hypothetical protein